MTEQAGRPDICRCCLYGGIQERCADYGVELRRKARKREGLCPHLGPFKCEDIAWSFSAWLVDVLDQIILCVGLPCL